LEGDNVKILENGEYRKRSAEEIAKLEARNAEIQAQARLDAIAERTRPLTTEEVSQMFITQQINTLTVDDSTALRMKDFYPEWATDIAYGTGFKVRRTNKLWRVLQAHTSQVGWEPENAASLWEQINETHEGTIDDPIPYEGDMTLTAGKYYYQNHAIYLCIRDTGNPVYHQLTQLTGIYVEEV
jgi:hypothetical protein